MCIVENCALFFYSFIFVILYIVFFPPNCNVAICLLYVHFFMTFEVIFLERAWYLCIIKQTISPVVEKKDSGRKLLHSTHVWDARNLNHCWHNFMFQIKGKRLLYGILYPYKHVLARKYDKWINDMDVRILILGWAWKELFKGTMHIL